MRNNTEKLDAEINKTKEERKKKLKKYLPADTSRSLHAVMNDEVIAECSDVSLRKKDSEGENIKKGTNRFTLRRHAKNWEMGGNVDLPVETENNKISHAREGSVIKNKKL